jgi:hypothetical protein
MPAQPPIIANSTTEFFMWCAIIVLFTYFRWSLTRYINLQDDFKKYVDGKFTLILDKYNLDRQSDTDKIAHLEGGYKMVDKEIERCEERLESLEKSIKENHTEITKGMATLSENVAVLTNSFKIFVKNNQSD